MRTKAQPRTCSAGRQGCDCDVGGERTSRSGPSGDMARFPAKEEQAASGFTEGRLGDKKLKGVGGHGALKLRGLDRKITHAQAVEPRLLQGSPRRRSRVVPRGSNGHRESCSPDQKGPRTQGPCLHVSTTFSAIAYHLLKPATVFVNTYIVPGH